jgi:hypothetical protein
MDKTLEELKESFEQGAEKFKEDMAFTKKCYDEVVAEDKAERAAKRAEKKQDREDFFEGITGFVEKSVESAEEAFDIASGKKDE